MPVREFLSATDFSRPNEAMDLYSNTIRRGVEYNSFGKKTIFEAIILSRPFYLVDAQITDEGDVQTRRNTEEGRLSKFAFKARIIGNPSPHDYLPDPCKMNGETEEEQSAIMRVVNLHTTFVSSDDYTRSSAGLPNVGDKVRVELEKNVHSYNLQFGKFVGLADNNVGAPLTNEELCASTRTIFGGALSTSLTYSTAGACGERMGTAGERRTIDFNCFKLTRQCPPGNQSSTDIEQYLGPTSWENWLAAVRAHEAPTYSTVNSAGYLGHYQFGVAALETAGYLRTGSWNSMGDCKGQSEACRPTTDSVIDNDSNWTGQNGVNSKADYLANKNGCQEDAIRRHSNTHFSYLRRNDKLDLSNPNDVGGMLASAHLRGAGGARDMRDGTELADANGTFPTTYYVEIGSAVC